MSITLKPNADNSASILIGDTERLVIGSDGRLSVSSNNVLLPAASTTTSVSLPCFSAYKNSSNALTASANTKLTYPVENFDYGNCYDTSLSRFTPNVAGYYRIDGSVQYNATSTNGYLVLYKNGSVHAYGNVTQLNLVEQVATLSTLVYMNGSSDYVELYAYTTAAGSATYAGNYGWTVFSGFLAREA